MTKIKIFISYSRLNKMWLEPGQRGLIPWLEDSLVKEGVEFWRDTELRKEVGEPYKRKIISRIEQADLAVLLISQDFLNSSFIREIELPLIKQRMDRGQLGIVPILVDFANWKLARQIQWINERQMLPSEPEPLILFVDNLARWAKARFEILEAFTHKIETIRYERNEGLIAGPDAAASAEEEAPSPPAQPPDHAEGQQPVQAVEQAAGVEEDRESDPPPADGPADEPADGPAEPEPADLEPFDEHGRLRTNRFAFGLGDILIRSAKRRNLQRRACISLQDLICGLVRKGDLTRTVLMIMRLEPDKIYDKISTYPETGEPLDPEWQGRFNRLSAQFKTGKMSKDELMALLNFWFVRDQADFKADSLKALADSAQAAANRGLSKVSELLFLDLLLQSEAWQALTNAGMPSTQTFKKYLDKVLSDGSVDENGHWNFQGLDASAAGVIGRAHSLAQKYGYRPISHRVMLTALIYEEDGFGKTLLRSAGVDPEPVVFFLLGSLSAGSVDTFGLSYEACRPLVIPMAEQAKRLAGPGRLVSDEHLFRAFLGTASSGFKSWLQASALGLKLDNLLMAQRPPAGTLH